MSNLLDEYREVNISNYDKEDVERLIEWANDAYDRLYFLERKVDSANRVLSVITDVMGEW